ncbi:MAG: hypothetical protein RLY50_697, partial [Actinomycetota bacterium]
MVLDPVLENYVESVDCREHGCSRQSVVVPMPRGALTVCMLRWRRRLRRKFGRISGRRETPLSARR